MQSLNDHESRKLFFGILFGYEDLSPTDINEFPVEIIRKCGGLPLAIVSIASLLASEPNIERKKWKHFQDSLPSISEGMKDVPNLIYNTLPHLMYNSLPPRLRACLLYLSMYPQGSVIMKEELMILWVAEGFLNAMGGRVKEKEIAEGYFDELVSRRIVQAVDISNNGEVLSCTVHHLVLDFIRYKSMEENFVINVDNLQSTPALPDKVRRLSVQFGGVKSAYIPESIITSQVRSLTFWGFFKCAPSIRDFGLLRVLILHIWADRDKKSFDLTTIGKLFQLKYTKIECNITVKLPTKIRMLKHLETLQVEARLSVVPSDIVQLERLLHLRLPSECILPSVIAQMPSLRGLGYFDLSSHSQEDVMFLGRLTNLQDLQLSCSTVHPPAENLKRNVQILCSILEKLSILQSLTLVPAPDFSRGASINIASEGFSMVSPPSGLLLQRIELSRRCCIFFRLPRWFVELRTLCNLKIAIRQLWNEDFDILKGIPSLTAITLYIQTAPAEDRINIDKEGFQVLTYFKFVCATPPRLFFKQGAMPKVQKLNLGFNANNRRSHTFGTVGLGNLAGLVEIFVKLGARDDDKVNIQAAESALQVSIKHHPNAPMLRVSVQRVGIIFDGDEDQSTATELRDIARKKIMLQTQQGKKNSTEEEKDSALEIQEDKKTNAEGAEQHVNKQVEIRYGFSSKTKPAALEIQEDEKANAEGAEKHVNKQVKISYARRDPSFTPLRHHQQSVDLLSGAIGPLLPKLEVLSNYNLGGKTEGRANRLRHDLDHMKTTLWGMAGRESQQLHKLFNVCGRDIRDLSYVADDAIDSFLVCVQASRGGSKWHLWLVDQYLSRWKACHEIAQAINDILRQADVLKDRLMGLVSQYHHIANPAESISVPNLSNRYTYTKELVGIKDSRDVLISKLINGTNDELKIVSIVGIGGLGKTTLAKSVYDRVQLQFDCRAFVSVCFEPDMKKVLMDILLQIDKKKYTSLCGATLDTTELTDVIQRLLADKRYLIIVDEICDVASWEIINRVLVDSKLGSRVVTTTRSSSVVEKAGGVYRLNALSAEDSKVLLNTRLFCGSEEESTRSLPEVSSSLLQKCGGVPLAIVAMASFLAHEQVNDWYKLNDNCSNETGGDADIMMTSNIVEYVIYNLPYHLRACLFHLHIFPMGYLIKKETLIWKWAAEGFIVAENGTGLFELGEAYFKELVNRNLVMPVEDDSDCGRVIGCRVHILVLDVIRGLSIEENFVTVQGDNMQTSCSGAGARRLAVNKWYGEQGDPLTNCPPERLRSFNAMGCHFGTELSLSRFKLLRVISIEECTSFERNPSNLRHIGKLLLLRYLGLYNTPIHKLPEEIGDLVSLQTLDLRGTNVKELPKGVSQLSKLKCLRADQGTYVPHWIGCLISLEELRLGRIGGSFWDLRNLGRLRELRELEIWIEFYVSDAFVQSMNNLHKLQVLRIMSASSSGDGDQLEGYEPPLQLRELHLTNIYYRLPDWVHVSRIPMLSYLHVNVGHVRETDLMNLGSLPNLVTLKLLMSWTVLPTIKGNGAFPKLRYFGTSTAVSFLPGAVPCLESLRFRVGEPTTVFKADISALSNLRSLLKVEVEIISGTGIDVKEVHMLLNHALGKHPNSPIIDVIKTDQV